MKTSLTKRGYFVLFLTLYLVIEMLKHLEFSLNASINYILSDIYKYETKWYTKDNEKIVGKDILLSALENYIKNDEL